MERRRSYDIICAAVWLYLVLAAALGCSAGRMSPTNDRAARVLDSHKSLMAGIKSRAVFHRLSKSREMFGGDMFAVDYTYNPGNPRPVPAAPKGRTPKIGAPPSPPITEITPQVPPPPVIVSPSPPPPFTLLPPPLPLPPLLPPLIPNPLATPPVR